MDVPNSIVTAKMHYSNNYTNISSFQPAITTAITAKMPKTLF